MLLKYFFTSKFSATNALDEEGYNARGRPRRGQTHENKATTSTSHRSRITVSQITLYVTNHEREREREREKD